VSEIATLVAAIDATPGCVVYPPNDLPAISAEHMLPSDLREFYGLCGGCSFFEADPNVYGVRIVAAHNLVSANAVITGLSSEELAQLYGPGDISWSWYIIGMAPNAQWITIDLSPSCLGRCYDSFWDRHPWDAVVIATSFTDLLRRLLDNAGEHWYCCRPDFEPLEDPGVFSTPA